MIHSILRFVEFFFCFLCFHLNNRLRLLVDLLEMVMIGDGSYCILNQFNALFTLIPKARLPKKFIFLLSRCQHFLFQHFIGRSCSFYPNANNHCLMWAAVEALRHARMDGYHYIPTRQLPSHRECCLSPISVTQNGIKR